jgi:hypothetical protein
MEVGIENMTLRDYFAAKALPAVYEHWKRGTPVGVAMELEDWVATHAYMMADAMMIARGE